MIRDRHSILPALVCGALVLAMGAIAAPIAHADVSGLGPDESIAAAAGPLAPGTTYSGAFTSPEDIDYVYFEVPQPETLRFDVVNTLTSCPSDPFERLCPLWGTLIEGNGQQLGGAGSTAGTGEVDYASYEEVEWTFATPGRCFLVIESNYYGTLPSFQLSYDVVPPGGGGGGGGGGTGSGGGGAGESVTGTGGSGSGISGGGGGRGSNGGEAKAGEVGVVGGRPTGSFTVSGSSRSLLGSLRLARRQRGTHVIVTAVLSQRLASLDLELLAPIGSHRRLTLVGRLRRRHPSAGFERIAVPVKAGRWLTSRRYTRLVLRARALAGDGAAELIEGRLLLRR